jgi:hypothetical protein
MSQPYPNLTWVPQYDNPPAKPKLESIPEIDLPRTDTVSSRSSARILMEICTKAQLGYGSLTDFEDVGLLLGPDQISPPPNTPELSESQQQWSPRVDLKKSQRNSIQTYLSDVICLASGKNDRKRVRVRSPSPCAKIIDETLLMAHSSTNQIQARISARGSQVA